MYVAEEGEAGMQGVDADDEDVDAATPEPTATEGDEPADDGDTAEATAEPTEEAAPDASIGDDEEAEADATAEDEDAAATDEEEDAEDGGGVDGPAISGQLHLVQEDETLADIAAQYGVTEAQIIAANALESGTVTNGMILKIPAA